MTPAMGMYSRFRWHSWFAWRPVVLPQNEYRTKPQWAWCRTIMRRRHMVLHPLPQRQMIRWRYEEPFIVATFHQL